MVDDGAADREPAVKHSGRWRRNAGFLQIDDDLAIDPVGIVGAIAEADNVEVDRREQLEPWLGAHSRFEIGRQRATVRDDRPELVGAYARVLRLGFFAPLAGLVRNRAR